MMCQNVERPRRRRWRGELGVELHAPAPGVVGQLDCLDQCLVAGEDSADEAGFFQVPA
jgi:hypothetical protein